MNPGNYRWNPLPANYADDRSYEHIRRWRHLTGYKFNANATDETKICQRVPFVRTILLLSLGAVISVPKLQLRLISRFGPCFYRFYSFDQNLLSRDKPSALVKCCWCQKIYLNKQLCRKYRKALSKHKTSSDGHKILYGMFANMIYTNQDFRILG